MTKKKVIRFLVKKKVHSPRENSGYAYAGDMCTTTGAALLDNNETTAKSTTEDGGMAGNFG